MVRTLNRTLKKSADVKMAASIAGAHGAAAFERHFKAPGCEMEVFRDSALLGEEAPRAVRDLLDKHCGGTTDTKLDGLVLLYGYACWEDVKPKEADTMSLQHVVDALFADAAALLVIKGLYVAALAREEACVSDAALRESLLEARGALRARVLSPGGRKRRAPTAPSEEVLEQRLALMRSDVEVLNKQIAEVEAEMEALQAACAWEEQSSKLRRIAAAGSVAGSAEASA